MHGENNIIINHLDVFGKYKLATYTQYKISNKAAIYKRTTLWKFLFHNKNITNNMMVQVISENLGLSEGTYM